MRRIISIMLMMLSLTSFSSERCDEYDVKMYLYVPRVYNNSDSLGYRKYQKQRIVGKMFLTLDEQQDVSVSFSQFTNLTHSVGGQNVTYDVYVDEDYTKNFSWCGNNKTQKFKRHNLNLSIGMTPSYKIGSEQIDDMMLHIACTSGGSRMITCDGDRCVVAASANGYATGQIGCNCSAYGHVSPTRKWSYFGPSTNVTDVASVNGIVRMKFKKTYCK